MTFDAAKPFALLAVLMVGVAGCSALGTTVADDDPDTEVPNTSMGRALLEGVGAIPSRQQQIAYTPRAPLVVPPSTAALAAPESSNPAQQVANWPVDPDVVEAQRLREAAARDKGRDDKDIIPASELAAASLPVGSNRTAGYGPTDLNKEFDDSHKPLPPSELNKVQIPKSGGSPIYDASGAPRRVALVQPPVEYLQPAPGTPVTTETGEKKDTPSFWQRIKFW